MIVIVAFGGGTNSTAMLITMVLRGEPAPHAILFADTGGERPEIYEFIRIFSEWLVRHGYPPITVVRKGGNGRTLEEDCLIKNMLPSIAYGYKSCSHKFKVEPQNKWSNNDPTCKAEWAAGRKVVKLIGYDADEPQRASIPEDKKYIYRYPLIEWDMGRDECVQAIRDCRLPLPGKSACFFCPNSKPDEICKLGEDHPNLLQRALQMEDNAHLTKIKGLGRGRFAWRDLVEGKIAVESLLFNQEMPCGCYDGD